MLGEDKLKKGDQNKIEILDTIRLNPGINNNGLIKELEKHKTTIDNSINFLIRIGAVENRIEKQAQNTIHHYYLTELGELIWENFYGSVVIHELD